MKLSKNMKLTPAFYNLGNLILACRIRTGRAKVAHLKLDKNSFLFSFNLILKIYSLNRFINYLYYLKTFRGLLKTSV